MTDVQSGPPPALHDFAPGRVITFYSYKGGVGRTFALADVAVFLSRWGFRVLCVDWDLEAPGLDAYLSPSTVTPVDGVLEFLEGVVAGADHPPVPQPVGIDGTGDRLWSIRAGRRDETYNTRFQALRWDDLYAPERRFLERMEQLRATWQRAFDFILIDSRTGLSDAGALCSIYLPDILVALFTPNKQSYEGTKALLAGIEARQRALNVDRAPLRVVPVIARLEAGEHNSRSVWTYRAIQEMKHYVTAWEPDERVDSRVLEQLAVPHVGFFSYDERLAADADVLSPGSVGAAHANLAALLLHGARGSGNLITNRTSYVPIYDTLGVFLKAPATGSPFALAMNRRFGAFQVGDGRNLIYHDALFVELDSPERPSPPPQGILGIYVHDSVVWLLRGEEAVAIPGPFRCADEVLTWILLHV